MKQEILCKHCAREARKISQSAKSYPEEYIKFKDGSARRNFICDGCGALIFAKADCTAFSMWSRNIPGYNWESRYIKPA